MENKTYKELYKEDILKVKEWINNCTPFDFHKENGDTWEFGEYYITDAISDFVDPILNPKLLWKTAQKEIDKLYNNLYHENHWSNRFETNIGTIYATYCFIGQDKIIFYDKNHKEVTSLDKGIIDFVKNDNGIVWKHD